ncbi:MAG TPA: Spy/CpxP family protein refolding chaperone [Polyangia bacterium]|nr:Spy/CpxP family protein refolding chaperone [Polyangia bacterium]
MDNQNLVTDIEARNDNGLVRTGRARLSRRVVGGLAALVVGGALSLGVAQAHGPGGMGGGMGFFGGGMMGFRMHKLLDKVGATDAQRAQIKTIWEGLKPQLKGMHEQHMKLHEQVTAAMTAATIDPAAVEKLRQQGVQLMDQASTIITKGMVQTAQVLTPDQRKQIAAELQKEADNRRAHFQEHGPDAF